MTGPHQNQPLATTGTPLEKASVAVVLVHGRGATAESILEIAGEVVQDGVWYGAPQAAGNTWYPNAFTAPVESNEPGLSSGLQAVGDAIAEATAAGIPFTQVLVLGFSQGACLASEYVARNPHRYGGLVVLSGGLIGETIEPTDYVGDLERTPVFFGCSDADPHIPADRVHESATIFDQLNADVTKRLYEGMGHGVNQDELEFVTGMITDLS